MIRVYTTNTWNRDVLHNAAESKNYPAEFHSELITDELQDALREIDVLIFDLTVAAFSADSIINAIDSVDSELMPPVLYILSSPADIELITETGSIVNQDYIFVPIEPNQLAARLEVLMLLGNRRRLTMETAIQDRLTGLYNRKYFLRRLEEELYRSIRYNYNVSVLLTSIDFSTDNGELTEETGTGVIKGISEFLKDRLRKTDIISRYKWDDFAFLLPDISADDSLAVAEDIKKKIELLDLSINGTKVHVKASIGHACFPSDGLKSAIDVIEALEDCCFNAKQSKESGIVSYQVSQKT